MQFYDGTKWFTCNYSMAGGYLRDMFENYKNYTEKAKRQAFKSKNEFSWDAMKTKVEKLLTEYVPEFPKQVEIKLPSLKKIELPKLQKING